MDLNIKRDLRVYTRCAIKREFISAELAKRTSRLKLSTQVLYRWFGDRISLRPAAGKILKKLALLVYTH